MVEFVVLLMPRCSCEYSKWQDYDSIEAKYFKRNSRVQWSEWHEWWYNDRGERIDPDRWRLWRMWKQHNCSGYTARLREAPWVQTLWSKMSPPRRFDVCRVQGFTRPRGKRHQQSRPGAQAVR